MEKTASGVDLMGHAFRKTLAMQKKAAITRPQAWMSMKGTASEVGVLDNALHNAEDRLSDLRKQLPNAEGADRTKVKDAISGYEKHVDELKRKRVSVVERGEARIRELGTRKTGPLEWVGQKLGIGGRRQHLVEHGSTLTAMKHPVVDVPPPSVGKRMGKVLGKHGKGMLIGGGALLAGAVGGQLISRARERRRAAAGEGVTQ